MASARRTPPARTAGQRELIAVVALVVLGIGATEVVRAGVPTGAEQPGTTATSPAAGSEAEPGRTAEVVGPAAGAEVAAYVDDRTAALLEAPDTVDTAVVSFDDVLDAEDALAVVGGGAEVRALLYRLPLAEARARVVRVAPGSDPAAALRSTLAPRVEELRTELASTRELVESDTVEDEAFLAEYERRVGELEATLSAVEDGRIVHAVVVRADLPALQALVDAVAVRLVDPAPPGTDVALSTFHGLLPSDTETVSEGRAAA